MRRNRLVAVSLLSLLAAVTAPPLAQAQRAGGIISNRDAGRYGLRRSWFAQVQLDSSKGHLGHTTLHVSTVDTQTYYEVEYDGELFTFSERQLDAFGKPLGPEGAKLAAERKAADLKDQAADQENAPQPRIEKHVVPEATLYISTDLGAVHAIDAETGQTRWVTSIGNPRYPTLEVGANNHHVAAVNGSTLYVMNAKTGEMVWQRRVKGVPGAGPALSELYVYVPMISGALESYILDVEDYKRAPYVYSGGGRCFVQPTVTPRTVSWVTDRGHMFVGNSQANGIKYRLEAQDSIVSPSVNRDPNFLYVSSIDGYVYCVTENDGDILWRFSAGEPISHAPIVIGEEIFVISDDGSFFKVNAETGEELWRSPNVRRFLAASNKRLYCVNRVGRVAILNRESGGLMATVNSDRIDMAFTNLRTDRIYVASRNGTVQCLHEIEARWPIVHAAAVEEAAKPKEIQQGEPAPPAEEVKPMPKPADDPFQNDKPDPFQSNVQPGQTVDPFSD